MTAPSPPDPSPLGRLREVDDARAQLDDLEWRLIGEARADGATWAQIATALGLASRQAAEQRWMRLGGATTRDVGRLRDAQQRQRSIDTGYGHDIAALRAAVFDLHRRLASQQRWKNSVATAELLQATLVMAVDAPPGALFELAERAMSDLGTVRLPSAPAPVRDAADALRAALRRATPGTGA
jgi:hypothetical protein